MRQREDHVHIGNIQQFLFTSCEPLVTSVGLALSAMAVSARVIRDGLMAAARALIQMTAQRRRAAALDGAQHAEMLPVQSGSILLNEAFACCSNDVGHLEGWRVHLLCSLRERFTCSGSENCGFVDGRAGRFQMTFGKMQVNGGRFQVGVTEQQLHCGQVRSVLPVSASRNYGAVNGDERLW